MTGRKDDKEKNKLEILFCHFPNALEYIGWCATYGANEYNEGLEERNWAKVANPKARYTGALFRHLLEWCKGNKIDSESGQSHLAHAAWNLLVLMELDE